MTIKCYLFLYLRDNFDIIWKIQVSGHCISTLFCISYLIVPLGSSSWEGGVAEVIEHWKSLLTEGKKSHVPGLKCKGLTPTLFLQFWSMEMKIQDGMLQDDTPETSLFYVSIQIGQLLVNISS